MRFFLLPTVCVLSFWFSAQTTLYGQEDSGGAPIVISYPYNPDSDSNGAIGLEDLLDLLAIYATDFAPDGITVEGMSLEAYLVLLSSQIAQLQAQVATANDPWGVVDVVVNPDNTLTFEFSDGSTLQTPLLVGPQGPAGPAGEPGLPVASGADAGTIAMWNGDSWVTAPAVAGCMDVDACNYDANASVSFPAICEFPDECGICGGAGAIFDCGCTPIPAGACDCNGNVVDALGNCGGGCSADADGDGVCDDGDSCIGQADVCGVCNGPGAVYACGCIGIPAGYCNCEGGLDADDDGVCDEIDPCVGTPDAIGVCNGPCNNDLDDDGICDDDGQDSCFGNIDLCGVCNGPGPVYSCGCVEQPEGDCDCAGNPADEFGNCPDYLVDTNSDGLYDAVTDPCLGVNTIELDGYAYDLVAIGTRCWFAENLRATHYLSGADIPQISDEQAWGNASTGAMCAFGNDISNVEAHGYLYNWPVTTDARGICPTHWRVPTEAEWNELAGLHGGLNTAGSALKESGYQHWNFPNAGATNASGFTARGSGERGFGTAGFINMGIQGNWWSSTSNGASGVGFTMVYNSEAMVKHTKSLTRGQSIRCVRKPSVFGCTDVNFLEYDPLANVNDGSCTTPSIPGCTSVGFAEYNPAANVDDGSCLNLLNCSNEDFVEFHGYEYNVIALGGKCWFRENLRTAYFANGDSIQEILDPVEWMNTPINQTPAWSFYQNLPANDYMGKLYNFYAVRDDRNLCPTNWHVSTDADWLQLEASLGMPAYDLYLQGWRGGTFRIGDLLKSTSGWLYPAGVQPPNNPSGFDAILTGHRGYEYAGAFSIYDVGGTLFWTSTAASTNKAYYRLLKSDNRAQYAQAGVHRDSGHYFAFYPSGLSVRCVRD